MHLEALDHVGLAVADVARSVAWYTDVLGLQRVHEQAWGDFPAVLEANGSGIALFPRTDGHPIGPDDPLRHIGFRTTRAGLDQARAELTARAMWFDAGDYGIAWSLYFPDPDGYLVEITTYEPPGDDTESSEQGRGTGT